MGPVNVQMNDALFKFICIVFTCHTRTSLLIISGWVPGRCLSLNNLTLRILGHILQKGKREAESRPTCLFNCNSIVR